jgi:hypothetical protein
VPNNHAALLLLLLLLLQGRYWCCCCCVLLLPLPLQLPWQRPHQLRRLRLVRGETVLASPAQYCLAEGWVRALLLMQQLLQVEPRKACGRIEPQREAEKAAYSSHGPTHK